jgi:hypothetical protein
MRAEYDALPRVSTVPTYAKNGDIKLKGSGRVKNSRFYERSKKLYGGSYRSIYEVVKRLTHKHIV